MSHETQTFFPTFSKPDASLREKQGRDVFERHRQWLAETVGKVSTAVLSWSDGLFQEPALTQSAPQTKKVPLTKAERRAYRRENAFPSSLETAPTDRSAESRARLAEINPYFKGTEKMTPSEVRNHFIEHGLTESEISRLNHDRRQNAQWETKSQKK